MRGKELAEIVLRIHMTLKNHIVDREDSQMDKILAQGYKWELTQEGDQLYLSLGSEYGTVELKSKSEFVLGMLESIEREYNKLKEEGPIEITS